MTQIKRVQVGKEFRIQTPNDRIKKVRSDFQGTPLYIRCTSGTGIIEPKIIPVFEDGYAEIHFQEHYLLGKTYTFIITEQDRYVKEYTKPPVEKSVAGLQYFRGEIQKSQESLDQKFSGNALSFDQSYFTRTVGQIYAQHKLEEKLGNLSENFSVFSGAGFGSLQAFSCALGYGTEELFNWYLGNLLKVLKKNIVSRGWELLTSVLFNHDHDRYKGKAVAKEVRKFFKAKDVNGNRTDRDLTIKDCKKDVYIPVWDISRRTLTITKTTFPDMPIYVAVCAAMLDPIFFEAKPMFDGFGVMAGDIAKNNDVYLKKYNPNLNITSIGCPVRVFDKGFGRIDERSKLIKMDERRHDGDLDLSRACGKRLECTPIDECFQFAMTDQAISTAQKSGDINV